MSTTGRAFDQKFDAAIVITNDSDLVAPIRIVRKKFNKPVIALMPVCNNGRSESYELKKVASKTVRVNASLLAASQFPMQMTDGIGTFHKPSSW